MFSTFYKNGASPCWRELKASVYVCNVKFCNRNFPFKLVSSRCLFHFWLRLLLLSAKCAVCLLLHSDCFCPLTRSLSKDATFNHHSPLFYSELTCSKGGNHEAKKKQHTYLCLYFSLWPESPAFSSETFSSSVHLVQRKTQ